jgi:hypothetical protein
MLRLKRGQVEARHDFDDEDVEGQFVDVADFQGVLQDWRLRIVAGASTSTSPMPEAYRRNPMPELPV